MGILRRLKSLFSGFVDNTTDKLESKNPQWLIADAEEKIRKSRKKAQQQLIEIQTWAERIRLDLRETEEQLESIQEQKSLAINKKDKELLAKLLLKEDDTRDYCYHLKMLYENAVAEALRIRDNFHKFEAQINEKTRLLKNIKSQNRLAEIRGNILKLEESYGQDSELNESMDKLRYKVNMQSAGIMAAEQLRKESLEAKISSLEQESKWKNALERAGTMLE